MFFFTGILKGVMELIGECDQTVIERFGQLQDYLDSWMHELKFTLEPCYTSKLSSFTKRLILDYCNLYLHA